MSAALLIARIALVVVFAVSGTAKLVDPAGTRQAAEALGVRPRWGGLVARIVPFAELTAAALLGVWVSPYSWFGALLAALLLITFSVAIAANLAKGNTPDCRCFGQIRPAPISGRLLVRNGALCTLALMLLLRGPR